MLEIKLIKLIISYLNYFGIGNPALVSYLNMTGSFYRIFSLFLLSLIQKQPLMEASFPGESYFVFLGGSCGTTTWRRDIAIPALEKNGISYYNPQVADWNPSLVEKEKNAKKNSQCLVFVISRETSSAASMIEAAYYIGLKRACLFLHADKVLPGQAKEIAPADVTRARAYLADVAKIENVQLPEGLKMATSVVSMMKVCDLFVNIIILTQKYFIRQLI